MSGNIALEDLGDVHIFPRLHCTLNHGGHPSIPFRIFMDHIHSLQKGTKSYLENTLPPREPIPTWNDISSVSAKLSASPKIKFPIHSHLENMLQKVFKMTGIKLAIVKLLLIGIYWYQSTRTRFIHSHLLIHSHKDDLTTGYYQARVNTFSEFI